MSVNIIEEGKLFIDDKIINLPRTVKYVEIFLSITLYHIKLKVVSHTKRKFIYIQNQNSSRMVSKSCKMEYLRVKPRIPPMLENKVTRSIVGLLRETRTVGSNITLIP